MSADLPAAGASPRLVATGSPPAPISNLRPANIYLGRLRTILVLGKIS